MPAHTLRDRIRQRLADETGRIAKQAPIAVRATRENSWIYATKGQEAAIAAMPHDRAMIVKTEDFTEGVRSFNERRDGVFRGK